MARIMRMSLLVVGVVLCLGVHAHAATIAFDMRNSAEGQDLEDTGSATKSGVTMSATTNGDASINAAASELGIDSPALSSVELGTKFFDYNGNNTGTEEFLDFTFDVDVTLDSIDFTSFGTSARATLTIGAASPITIDGSADNTNPYAVNTLVAAGTHIVLSYQNHIDAENGNGNGWGIETVTVTTLSVPTPAALPAGLGLLGLLAVRRRRA